MPQKTHQVYPSHDTAASLPPIDSGRFLHWKMELIGLPSGLCCHMESFAVEHVQNFVPTDRTPTGKTVRRKKKCSNNRIIFFQHIFFCQHLSTGTVLVLVISQQICIICCGGLAINPEPRGPPQGRRERRDAGGGAPGWCSSRVLAGGMSPSGVVCDAGFWRMRLAANGACAAIVSVAGRRAMGAWTAAFRKVGTIERVRACAKRRRKAAASLLHLPSTSIARTTRRQRAPPTELCSHLYMESTQGRVGVSPACV